MKLNKPNSISDMSEIELKAMLFDIENTIKIKKQEFDYLIGILSQRLKDNETNKNKTDNQNSKSDENVKDKSDK